MAGEAKTTDFNIGVATVMLGDMAQVEDLTPKEHSIGLVKNFTTSATDSYVDLTQGIQNDVVWSEKTGSETTATMEVYEYTAKNISYALGLDGRDLIEGKMHKIRSIDSQEVTIEAENSTGADFMEGDRICIQSADKEDLVFLDKLTSVTFNPTTAPEIALSATSHDFWVAMNKLMGDAGSFTLEEGKLKLIVGDTAVVAFSEPLKTAFGFTDGTGPATGTVTVTTRKTLSGLGITEGNSLKVTIDSDSFELIAKASPVTNTDASYTLELSRSIPSNMSFKAGDKLKKVNIIKAGSRAAQPFLGAKVVGILPDGHTPITIIYPKVRITNGFNIGFQSDTYSNMPFEFTPFRQVEGDPLYEEHGDELFYILK